MGIIEKIKEIEAEMARTQKNKATGSLSFLSITFCPLLNIFIKLFYGLDWIVPNFVHQ